LEPSPSLDPHWDVFVANVDIPSVIDGAQSQVALFVSVNLYGAEPGMLYNAVESNDPSFFEFEHTDCSDH
jgi:hypothetical protein